MLASTRMDLVPNVDSHIVMVPSPAGPVPTPMPFVFAGLVFGIAECAIAIAPQALQLMASVADFQTGQIHVDGGHGLAGTGIVAAGEFALQLASLADPVSLAVTHARGTSALGRVKINGLWATKAGDTVTNLLIHQFTLPLPIVPPASDSADLNFGALMVFFENSAPVRLGEIAQSCSMPIDLPTAVIALPKGYPVLILRQPAPDLMSLAKTGLGHVAGLTARRIARTRWMGGLRVGAKRLAGRIFGPGRMRSWARSAICHFTGEPVDVSAGRVVSQYEEVCLPGPIPLVIERFYDSSLSWREGSLGHGWHLSLDERIWQEPGRVVVRRRDGREVELDSRAFADGVLPVGGSLHEPVDDFTVHRTGEHIWELHEGGMVQHYATLVLGHASRILRIRDEHSLHAIDFGYDDHHELAWVRDSCGRTLYVETDPRGRIAALKLPVPEGRGWVVHRRYHYDAEGDLVRVDDTRRASWNYAYVAHLKVRKTDRTGLSWLYEYDGVGPNARCTRTWGSGRDAQQEGLLHRVLHYASGKTIVEDGEGRATVYTMGETGLVSEERDALGRVSLIERDAATASVSSLQDTNGLRARFERDAKGRVVVEHSEFAKDRWKTSRMTYDSAGRLTNFVNGRGLAWSWRYDSLGRPIEESGPVGSPRRMEWNGGLLVRATEGELSTEFVYDETLNLSAVRSLRGEVRYGHDNLGRVRKVVSPQGGVMRHRYDSEGCLVQLESLTGVVQRAQFDAEDNLIELRDVTRSTRWTYGNFHEVVARHEGDAKVEFAYNTEGLLQVVRNEHGEEATYEYDALARIKAETGFDGARRVYTLSKEGPATHITMPSGAYHMAQLDHAGRVTEKRRSDGTFARYTYDDDGQLVRAENESCTVELARDAFGRLREERVGEHSVSSRFLPDGTRGTMLSSLGARVEIHRDEEGQLAQLRVGGAQQYMGITFSHDALGSEVSRAFDNGIEDRWRRDLAGRPTMHQTTRAHFQALSSVVRERGRETLESRNYDWRGEDQIAVLEDWKKGPRHFDHDARGRLIRASAAPWT